MRKLTTAMTAAFIGANPTTGRLADDVKTVTRRALVSSNLADQTDNGTYLTPGTNGAMAHAARLRTEHGAQPDPEKPGVLLTPAQVADAVRGARGWLTLSANNRMSDMEALEADLKRARTVMRRLLKSGAPEVTNQSVLQYNAACNALYSARHHVANLPAPATATAAPAPAAAPVPVPVPVPVFGAGARVIAARLDGDGFYYATVRETLTDGPVSMWDVVSDASGKGLVLSSDEYVLTSR